MSSTIAVFLIDCTALGVLLVALGRAFLPSTIVLSLAIVAELLVHLGALLMQARDVINVPSVFLYWLAWLRVVLEPLSLVLYVMACFMIARMNARDVPLGRGGSFTRVH
jgi:hypothetical protein